MASPRAGATGCSGDWRRACSSPSPATSSDLRAARPAGPGVARRRPAARAAGAQRLAAAWRVGLPGTDPIAVRAVPRLPAAGLARRAEVHRRAAGQRRRLARAAAGVLAEAAVLGSVLQRRAGATGGGQRAGRLVASRRPAGDPLAFVRRLARRGAPALALPAAGGTVPAMPAWRRLAETTSAGRRSSRDAGRCAGGCGRCPGGGHRWCTGGSCGRGTGSRRWPCG